MDLSMGQRSAERLQIKRRVGCIHQQHLTISLPLPYHFRTVDNAFRADATLYFFVVDSRDMPGRFLTHTLSYGHTQCHNIVEDSQHVRGEII